MQATIQQPNLSGAAALGYWPAFWSLGSGIRSGGTWPGVGEIDILEDVNGLGSVYGTLHCGVDPGGPCNEPDGIGSGQRACSGCQTAFHVYRVEIDRSVSPEQIRWYLDGVNYFTVSANQVDPTTWANAVDHSFFIIFDLAMGGGFPNGVSGQTTPNASTQSGGAMLVSDVSVFTASGCAPTPTPTPRPTNTPTPTPTSINSTPTPTPTVGSGNLVSNPGFETGNLTGWSCASNDTEELLRVIGKGILSRACENQNHRLYFYMKPVPYTWITFLSHKIKQRANKREATLAGVPSLYAE